MEDGLSSFPDDAASAPGPADTPCAACATAPGAPDRRAFLRQATLAVGGVLAALGLPGEAARAWEATTAVRRSGTTRSYALPDKDGVQIDRDAGVILVRWLGSVYAFALDCPHQKTALTWLDKDQRFRCPKHHSQFSPDGYFVQGSGRATRGMDRYAITRSGATIVVDLAVLVRESDDAHAWSATCVTLSA